MRKCRKDNFIYFGKKSGQMLVVLLLLSMVVFALAQLCPGEPLRAWYGDGVDRMSEAEKNIARENLGLDDSLLTQYLRWAGNLLDGDLGISYKYKQPVTEIIGQLWTNTLILGGISYVMTFLLAAGIGCFCAFHEGKLADRIICRMGVISSNIPTFFMALVLILIFSVNLRILPSGGAYSYGGEHDLADRLLHLVLPVTVLVLEHLWYYAYIIRNKLIEETRQDYVLLCKSKGMSRRRILCISCMKNILPGMLVLMATSASHILGGTYVVETVFSYPGLGTLSFEAAMYQDYNMLMALCLLTGAAVLVFNLLAQILSEILDPRMDYEGQVES